MEFMEQFINTLFRLIYYAIIARILLSWFRANPSGAFYRIIHDTTEPILGPARRMIPPVGMIDFSPIIVLILLDIVRGLILGLLSGL
jgi:YggT family protein